MSEDVLVIRMSALGHPIRLRLYRAIVASGEGGIVQGVLAAALGLQHNLVSYHLQPLVAAGLATMEKRGTNTVYRTDPIALNRLAASLLNLSSATDDRTEEREGK